MLKRKSHGIIAKGSSFKKIVVKEGEMPLEGNIVFLKEQKCFSMVTSVQNSEFTIFPHANRTPNPGEHFDCGVSIILTVDK